MAVTPKVLIAPIQAAASQTTLYTAVVSGSGGKGTIIDKCSVTNTTGSAATITINLVTLAGSASASNTIISAQSVVPGQCYLCPEIVGHILNPGDFISVIAGTATALTIRSSGRELT